MNIPISLPPDADKPLPDALGPDGDTMPVIAIDMPVMYEDEGQEEMGESDPHTLAVNILFNSLKEHFRSRPGHHVFSDLNLYYHRVDHWAYVSPDVMVVVSATPLPDNLLSYRIGATGPAPVLAIEVLSRRSFQQQDLTNKPIIYSRLGVREYILVDGPGEFLPQRLLLKRLQGDETWRDEQDDDGGVTSQLGFRILLEPDDFPCVLETGTGKRYIRPTDAQLAVDEAWKAATAAEAAAAAAKAEAAAAKLAAEAEAEARRKVEEMNKALLEQLKKLGGTPTEGNGTQEEGGPPGPG